MSEEMDIIRNLYTPEILGSSPVGVIMGRSHSG